jgi:hypothetical protein
MQKLCPKVTCRRCGQSGHMTAVCAVAKESASSVSASAAASSATGTGTAGAGKGDRKWAGGHQPRCLECGEVGHMQKLCPKVTCRRCGKIGHMSAACDV